jgi:hypothetical protein
MKYIYIYNSEEGCVNYHCNRRKLMLKLKFDLHSSDVFFSEEYLFCYACKKENFKSCNIVLENLTRFGLDSLISRKKEIIQLAYPYQFLYVGFPCPCPLSMLLAVWQPHKDNTSFIFLILPFSYCTFTVHDEALVGWFFG